MPKSNKFSVVREGYDIAEVDKFLKVVTTEFEKLVAKNDELENQILELNNQIIELEEMTSSVDLFKSEFDSFIESKMEYKKTLELEIKVLQDKLKDYERSARDIFYQQLELLEKIG